MRQPRTAIPSAPPTSELTSATPAAAPTRWGGALPTIRSVARVNTGAGVCSRCDEVEDVALGIGQGYPAAAVLVEAGDLPGAQGDGPVHLIIEGGDGQVEVDAVFGRGGLGNLAEDHAGCGVTGFE